MFCFFKDANLKRVGVGCSFLVVFYLKIAVLLRGYKKAVEQRVFNGLLGFRCQWVLPIVDGRRPVGAFYFFVPLYFGLAGSAKSNSKLHVPAATPKFLPLAMPVEVAPLTKGKGSTVPVAPKLFAQSSFSRNLIAAAVKTMLFKTHFLVLKS